MVRTIRLPARMLASILDRPYIAENFAISLTPLSRGLLSHESSASTTHRSNVAIRPATPNPKIGSTKSIIALPRESGGLLHRRLDDGEPAVTPTVAGIADRHGRHTRMALSGIHRRMPAVSVHMDADQVSVPRLAANHAVLSGRGLAS